MPGPVRVPRRAQFRVSLRAEGEGPPAVIRLRSFLKVALRAFGLRAVAVEELPGPAEPGTAPGSSPGPVSGDVAEERLTP
jgi:hypothetical protein